MTKYVLDLGQGPLSSNLVAKGLPVSLINPSNTVLFREGMFGSCPNDVTTQTGASYPGFNLLKESLLEATNGFTAS